MNVLGWLFDPANWTSSTGVFYQLGQHIYYTVLAMVIAMVIAVPLGAWIGHTGRGGLVVVGAANGIRALPSIGIVVLLFGAIGYGLIGPLVALVLLAIPPIMAGAYAGVRNVDRVIVDAARGMGMSERDVLLRVELPNALPLIFGGIRSALLQVISTATIAAYVGIFGLGRFIIDGLAQQDFPQMIGGSILVAVLAIAADLLLAGLQRLVVSPGLQANRARRRSAVPASRPAAQAA